MRQYGLSGLSVTLAEARIYEEALRRLGRTDKLVLSVKTDWSACPVCGSEQSFNSFEQSCYNPGCPGEGQLTCYFAPATPELVALLEAEEEAPYYFVVTWVTAKGFGRWCLDPAFEREIKAILSERGAA